MAASTPPTYQRFLELRLEALVEVVWSKVHNILSIATVTRFTNSDSVVLADAFIKESVNNGSKPFSIGWVCVANCTRQFSSSYTVLDKLCSQPL
jgi:hypothetical protein